jgi:hypothetical protein
MNASVAGMLHRQQDITESVQALLGQMTLAEKIGQMSQVEASHGYAPEYLGDRLLMKAGSGSPC